MSYRSVAGPLRATLLAISSKLMRLSACPHSCSAANRTGSTTFTTNSEFGSSSAASSPAAQRMSFAVTPCAVPFPDAEAGNHASLQGPWRNSVGRLSATPRQQPRRLLGVLSGEHRHKGKTSNKCNSFLSKTRRKFVAQHSMTNIWTSAEGYSCAYQTEVMEIPLPNEQKT
jgi:hypothetical protein